MLSNASGTQRSRFAISILRQQSGQTMIEFAISLGVLLTGIFTVIELCLMFYTWSTLSECAREGARYAIVRGSTCVTNGTTGAGASCTASASTINSYVSSLGYPNVGGGNMSVSTAFSSDGATFSATGNNAPNDLVRVQITYAFPVRLPFIPRSTINLKAQSMLTILQ